MRSLCIIRNGHVGHFSVTGKVKLYNKKEWEGVEGGGEGENAAEKILLERAPTTLSSDIVKACLCVRRRTMLENSKLTLYHGALYVTIDATQKAHPPNKPIKTQHPRMRSLLWVPFSIRTRFRRSFLVIHVVVE